MVMFHNYVSHYQRGSHSSGMTHIGAQCDDRELWSLNTDIPCLDGQVLKSSGGIWSASSRVLLVSIYISYLYNILYMYLYMYNVYVLVMFKTSALYQLIGFHGKNETGKSHISWENLAGVRCRFSLFCHPIECGIWFML